MEHVKYDLGQVKKGATVVVRVSTGVNVLLMDASNYRVYTAGRGGRFRYSGGLAKASPVRLRVPSTGHWFVALDLGGRRGRFRHGVSVLPPERGDLPAIRPASDSLRQFVRPTPEEPPSSDILGGQVWDVFISHASEDKATVVRPLADALRDLGVSVWLDALELKVGDSLRRKIDQGIRSSRFGVTILSPSFFGKGWPEYELDGLVTLSVAGKQGLLPIWHEVTYDDVSDRSASLADKFALRTADLSIDEIAGQIAQVVLEARV